MSLLDLHPANKGMDRIRGKLQALFPKIKISPSEMNPWCEHTEADGAVG